MSDTGIGIAPQDQEAVFEEFRQVGTDYAMKREGTGLGLTLSRKFVELHDGRIWVKSAVGQGSTFTFTLAGQAMANELILIVEDDGKNRKLARDVLVYRGYRIAEAETGEDGVRLARELRPDLVLMDIQLPGMDGMAALREIRMDPATRHIPVMAVTASAMTHDRQTIMAAGFDAYQSKPISVREFTAAVQDLLARPGGGAGMTARPRLLVVDDTPVNVKLLADLLAAKGYAVSTAASGQEALDTIEREPPDLVLLDVMMPGMSGYDVCRTLRENPATALLPVVMVTALDPVRGAREGH